MTTSSIPLIGASLASHWQSLDWTVITKQVKRLQMRIAKAMREGKLGKVKALQRLLTHSFYGKCLAVKRVIESKGARTPGTDKILWRTPTQKMKAVFSIKRRGYNPLPLRRIYIEKKNKRLRPISIPAMQDRAVQVLHRLALEPVAEEKADPNSYGFRPKRSTIDAIEQCFIILAKKTSAQWVLEGDIKGCFDNFESSWLEANIPMDKVILRKLLKAGYMEKDTVFPTLKGVPQGGPLSTTITLIALSGLETKLRHLFKKSKVNSVSYADDFIISGDSKEILESEVKPIVEQFLKERGLELSQEKTKITHIEEGFDFLGFNVRKYNGKLLIKPAKANIKKLIEEIKETIKSNRATKTENLIYLLNTKIRGWANYYRHVVSSKIFSKIDKIIYQALDRWMQRRHPNKGKRWLKTNYFRTRDLDQWQFFAKVKKRGNPMTLDLVKARRIHIRRHVKIKGNAHPYNPDFKDYFIEREQKRKAARQFIPLLTIIPDGNKPLSFKGLSVIR
ncbi:MAG TPA: group II intron reverse transcriptase/maturase [Alphaproteobacteria bacterium]|nr:group II intron reverse transcriptase/maturase [Alphaproteobacteria bacterium]HQS94799.1 group II intron reverse transcriptase/maturase [Alphaproteobacteria bacterium]